MLLKKIGVIKDMLLPSEFIQGEQQFGGKGLNWRMSFHPRKFKEESPVQLILYYRGLPPAKATGDAFRVLLSQAPQVLFNQDDSGDTKAIANILRNLGDALGTSASNQLVNKKTGLQGALFYMQKMAVGQVGKRRVLTITGIFHRSGATPEEFQNESSTNYSHAILFDAAAGNEPCRVEEIILQADSAELLANYLPAFERALQTVRWTDK